MVSLVNSHTNATRIGWHLWEIDLDLPLGYLQGGSLFREIRKFCTGMGTNSGGCSAGPPL